MAKKRLRELVFPVGGLSRRFAYEHQPPYSTVDALNVRPKGTLDGRERGGSRPGLLKFDPYPLGAETSGTMVGQPSTPDYSTLTATTDVFYADMAGQDYVDFAGTTYPILTYIDAKNVTIDTDASGESGAFTIVRTRQEHAYSYYATTDLHRIHAAYPTFRDPPSAVSDQVGDVIRVTASGNTYTITHVALSTKANIATEPTDADKTGPITIEKTATADTISAVGAGGGHSIVTADAVFTAAMVGETIEFFTSSARYTIVSYTDSTHVVVQGDASGETNGDTFIVYGDLQPIRMLAAPYYTRTVASSSYRTFSDTFTTGEREGLPLGDPWTAAGWADRMPVYARDNYAIPPLVSGGTDTGSAIAPDMSIYATPTYTIELTLAQTWGYFYGDYTIYFCMDDAATAAVAVTNAAFNGAVLHLSFGAAGDNRVTGTVKTYVNGVLQDTYTCTPYVLTDAAVNLSINVNGDVLFIETDQYLLLYQSVTAGTGAVGTRMGFGLTALTDHAGQPRLLQFVVRYSAEVVSYDKGSRRVLAASAGGNLYVTSLARPNRFTKVSVNPTINSDRLVSAVPRLEQLYVADCGDTRAKGTNGVINGATGVSFDSATYADWTTLGISTYDHVLHITAASDSDAVGVHTISTVAAGNLTIPAATLATSCHFYIERAPKVYDPSAGTFAIWTASTAGTLPFGCPLIALWNDRLVLAGAPHQPHEWHMSRQGNPLDWDTVFGPYSATSGASSDAGKFGEPITALVPHSDDYLIFAGMDAMAILRGDPTMGGGINVLSNSVGIIDKMAWCRGPASELIFLSRDGLYLLGSGANTYPESLSREQLPGDLLDISAEDYDIQLAYDTEKRGVHIFLTAKLTGSRRHWWYDWERKSFWPFTFNTALDPTSLFAYVADSPLDSGVLLGCRGGFVRRMSDNALGDDGFPIDSYVYYGPFQLGVARNYLGVLHSLTAALAEDSTDLDWDIYVGDTAQEAWESTTAKSTGTWTAGKNNRHTQLGRGACFYLKVHSRSLQQWAIEWIEAETQPRGRIQ